MRNPWLEKKRQRERVIQESPPLMDDSSFVINIDSSLSLDDSRMVTIGSDASPDDPVIVVSGVTPWDGTVLEPGVITIMPVVSWCVSTKI